MTNPLTTLEKPYGLAYYLPKNASAKATIEQPEIEPMATTTPIVPQNMFEAVAKQKMLGLKPWMSEFQANMPGLPKDKLSNAEPSKAVTTSLEWDIRDIDYEAKILSATATYQYTNKLADNGELILDIKNIDVESICVDGQKAIYKIIPAKPNDALCIQIPLKAGPGKVSITYKTQANANGIFWIGKESTEGKQHPMIYTLFQETEGAAVIPGQHSPQIRMPYRVHVNTNSPDLMALSSVKNNPVERTSDGKYQGLYMDRAVPLYLLSLQVGNFAYAPFSDNITGVYAEESMIKEAAEKLASLPEIMKAAIGICGNYTWQRYAAVIMGPAFPYKAMEHPCASTCGKICLEQPHVVGHELAHSWAGNDTTNAVWEQFFWNEGLTTFIEYHIAEAVWGTDYANLIFKIKLNEALEAMDRFRVSRPEAMKLCGQDTVFSRIPYAKGALFFFMLQNKIGKEDFARFLKDYMAVFYQNSMTDERFLEFLCLWLKNEHHTDNFEQFAEETKLMEWLYECEFPSNYADLKFDTPLFDAMQSQADFIIHNEPIDVEMISSWNPVMTALFLDMLKGKTNENQLRALDEQLNYTHSGSMTIKGAWVLLCAMEKYYSPQMEEAIIDYVCTRNSMLEADKISAALCRSGLGIGIAVRIINDARLFPITRKAVQKQLDLALESTKEIPIFMDS